MKVLIMNFSKRVIFLILFIIPLSCVNAVGLDGYVRNNYLVTSEKYGYEPKNRFHALGNVVKKKLTGNRSIHVNNTISKNLTVSNKKWLKNFVYEDLIETTYGEFVFFRLSNKAMDVEKPITSFKNPFIHSFALIKNKSVLLPKLEITIEDIETGGYTRELWDVFEYNSKKYILVFNRVYESHVFELYTIENNLIVKISDIEFGGL